MFDKCLSRYCKREAASWGYQGLALFISNVNGKSHHGLARNPINYFVGSKTLYSGKCEIGVVLVFIKAEGK